MKKFVIISLLVFLSALYAAAYTLTSNVGKVPDGYNFWLSTPDKTKGSDLKPVVIFLHGASLCGKNLNQVLRYGTIDALKRGLNLDAYVIAPQTPRGPWNPDKVMKVLDYVEQQHPDIDTSRVYVVGMSLGGYGAIDVANAYPERIAAALSFCGGGSGNDFSGLSQVPIWIVHGTADRAVSVKQSDMVVKALKNIEPGAPRLIYDRIAGMNHSRPARFFYMPQFYEWLFQHSLSDPGRERAEGFALTSDKINNAYRYLQTDNTLITIGEPIEFEERDFSHFFMPAGLEDLDDLEEIEKSLEQD